MKQRVTNSCSGKLLGLAGIATAAALVGALSLPVTTAAFSTIGGSLGTAQRDFRVFNNFTDGSANNNTTPHVNFPGQTGAVMAIWKGHVEWASEAYAGNGLGDGIASNPILGSGGANFDNTFQGLATDAGGNNSNIHSELAGGDGGTLAFTVSPISDGWTIKYYSNWSWQDGPGSVSSGSDIQGVACHEIGHSLGLGHTSTGGATMFASISGTGTAQRSVESDDIAGVQSIYGVISGTKPRITSLTGSKQIGQTLTINGANFSASSGEVWFTKANSDGVPVKVTNVSSNGTLINVTIPSGVQDGEVLVKTSGSGDASLSNAFPIDTGAAAGNPPQVTSINPNLGPAGGFVNVIVTGTGFTGATSVKFGATESASFTVDSNTQITAVSPPGPTFTIVDITVTDADGVSTLPSAYFLSFNPVVEVSAVTPSAGPVAGGTQVSVTGASLVGVTSVTFDGVAGTQFDVVSATEVTVFSPTGSAGPADVIALGDTSSTLAGGFTYQNLGSFTDIGPGAIGSLGFAPTLTGSGDLTPGSPSGFMLLAAGALPLANATMFISLSQASLPFKGTTLYTFPILLQFNFATSGFGSFGLPAQIPLGTPGNTTFFLQVYIQDAGGPAGFAATNGLELSTP